MGLPCRCMYDLSKGLRKAIRELAALAHDRELSAELRKLETAFQDWHEGKIDAFEVEQAIHRFYNGSARELFNRYSAGAVLDHAVAGAILRGTIQEAEIPEPARNHLARLVAVFRDLS